jgi:hypothetical protein
MVKRVASEDRFIHGIWDQCSEVNWRDSFSLPTLTWPDHLDLSSDISFTPYWLYRCTWNTCATRSWYWPSGRRNPNFAVKSSCTVIVGPSSVRFSGRRTASPVDIMVFLISCVPWERTLKTFSSSFASFPPSYELVFGKSSVRNSAGTQAILASFVVFLSAAKKMSEQYLDWAMICSFQILFSYLFTIQHSTLHNLRYWIKVNLTYCLSN